MTGSLFILAGFLGRFFAFCKTNIRLNSTNFEFSNASKSLAFALLTPFWKDCSEGKKDQQIWPLGNVLGIFLLLKIAQNEISQPAIFEGR